MGQEEAAEAGNERDRDTPVPVQASPPALGTERSREPADEGLWVRSVFPTPPGALKKSLDACLTYLAQHEGLSSDAALWQLLYLLAIKVHEEQGTGQPRRWLVGSAEVQTAAGRAAIAERMAITLQELQRAYPAVIAPGMRWELSDATLAVLAGMLAGHELATTELDPFSVVYQGWAGRVARESRGQFFTPLNAAFLVIGLLDPGEDERVLDCSCGAGSFFQALFAYRRMQLGLPLSAPLRGDAEGSDRPPREIERLLRYARERVYGAEIDAGLARVARMRLALLGGAPDHIYHMDSLAFPRRLNDPRAAAELPLGSLDAVVTNPPWGDSHPVSDPEVLSRYELAHLWQRTPDGGFANTGRLQKRVSPEVLFLERALAWLRPGGRLGMVIGNGLLSNPGDLYVRAWILRHAYVVASVELPRALFQPQAGVGQLASAFVLRKKTGAQMQADSARIPEFPVFMGVLEECGWDSRGTTVYRRDPEGELVSGPDRQPVVADDLPAALRFYRHFREEHRCSFPWDDYAGGER